MRVAINGIAALERKTGVGYYIDGLYRDLLAQKGSDDLFYYPEGLARSAVRIAREWFFPHTKKAAAAPAGATVRRGPRLASLVANPREVARNFARRACRKHFRHAVDLAGCDLYHEPNYIPWPCDLPTVVTVLDLSVLLHPEWHPIDRVKNYEHHFFRGLSLASHFIAISEFTRREMIDNLGIAPDRVSAIHIGIRPGFRPLSEESVLPALAELGLQPGYLLYVSTIEPRKNLLMLMRAYCSLPGELRDKHPLVLVGGWGWRAGEIADYYDQVGKSKNVRHFGYLPDAVLPTLYNGARSLVYPSHYEGFGLPPVEMLACGGAVLASTAASLVEVLQDSATLIDPNDEQAWANEMARVLQDADYCEQLRNGSEAFSRRYTWAECARKTWDVYRRFARRRMAA